VELLESLGLISSAQGASLSDIDGDELRRLRRTIETEAPQNKGLNQLPDVELLESLGLISGESISLAAVLLLGKAGALARWAPQHEVVFLRYKTSTSYDVRHDFKGPILLVLESLQRLLEANFKLMTLATEGFGELTLPDMTWFAAREAVLNALIHRNYFLRQSIYVHLHKDRLEITSPGGFIGGVTPQNILHHPPIRRNPLLADVAQKAGLVNRSGLGVDRIYEELLYLGKALPRYDADESHVRLTLPLASHKGFAKFVSNEQRSQRRLDLNDLIVLRTLTQRGHLDRWTSSTCLQLAEEEAADILASLRNRGYLATQGRGRGTTYRFSRHYMELLRPTEGDHDLPLDDEAVRLRLSAVLAEKGRLTNADVRRISGYSRTEAVRLMRRLAGEKIAVLKGRGRAAHYIPGPAASK
jgi:ATP-dependent DNA helicase RecG